MKKKLYRLLAVFLSSLMLAMSGSGVMRVQASQILTPFIPGFMTPGEIWNVVKNTIAFQAGQIGVFFSGSIQQAILDQFAYEEWMKDRYKNGFDGTPWNAQQYYNKECIRNEDGTFTLSDKLVDDTVAYIKSITDTQFNYMLVNTVGLKNISPTWFPTKTLYDDFVKLFDSHSIVYVGGIFNSSDAKYVNLGFLDNLNLDFAFTSSSLSNVSLYINWERYSVPVFRLQDGELIKQPTGSFGSNLDIANFLGYMPWLRGFVTKNGDTIRVFKNADTMKEYQAGYQPFYAGSSYNNYDSSKDNSMNVGGDYLTGNDWTTINNNYYNNANSTIINNGAGDLSANDLAALLDKLLEELKKNPGSGSGGDDPSGSGGGSDNPGGGSGLGSLIEGLGKLLDFILQAAGKLIGLMSDFLSNALGLLSNLTSFTKPFSNLLADLMPFVPAELWDIIIAGITFSVLITIFKAFKG